MFDSYGYCYDDYYCSSTRLSSLTLNNIAFLSMVVWRIGYLLGGNFLAVVTDGVSCVWSVCGTLFEGTVYSDSV